MKHRLALLLLGLILLLTPSSRTDTESGHPALLRASAGCSAWPGETVHYHRPERPISDSPAVTVDQSGAEMLELEAGIFADGIPDLSGTWAQLEVTSSLSNAPMVGQIRSVTTTIVRLELAQNQERLTTAFEVCGLEVDSEGALRTIIPDAFVEAIGHSRREARLEPEGRGFRLVHAPYTQVLGAQLAAPETEPLPTEVDDPRVADQDGDGRPGMTIRLEGFIRGEIYLVQRVTKALDGVVLDRNRVDGLIDWTMEQVTLDASSFLLDIDTEARADPVAERNYFQSRRIPPSMDCAAIVANRDRLFGQ